MAIAEKYYDERGRSPMPIASTLDEIGRPAWIVLMILGFMVWWPLGLAALAFLIGSGRMSCSRNGSHWEHKMGRLQDKMERVRDKMDQHMGGGGGGNWWGRSPSSGNRAFDEYRTETLQRLEEEQVEFRNFLERLRHAKDKEEFDAFMAQHKTRPTPPNDEPQG